MPWMTIATPKFDDAMYDALHGAFNRAWVAASMPTMAAIFTRFENGDQGHSFYFSPDAVKIMGRVLGPFNPVDANSLLTTGSVWPLAPKKHGAFLTLSGLPR